MHIAATPSEHLTSEPPDCPLHIYKVFCTFDYFWLKVLECARCTSWSTGQHNIRNLLNGSFHVCDTESSETSVDAQFKYDSTVLNGTTTAAADWSLYVTVHKRSQHVQDGKY